MLKKKNERSICGNISIFFLFSSILHLSLKALLEGVKGQNFVSGPGVWEWEKWMWFTLHLRLNDYKDD